jgi:4-carboxymuconolactone decarboxylase
MTDDKLEHGMEARRSVLGEAYVDQAVKKRSAFTADFQDLLTRYAWGEIWTRPGLDRRTRCCITVAMLVALNREEELALHVRAALDNGVSADELKEVLLQSAIYCGIPAANAAFRVASEVLASRA